MDDLELKKRIIENPITTVLGLVIAVGAVWTTGGDWRGNLLAAVFAVAGALMKHPPLGGGNGGKPA